ncbi:MAG: putative RNA methyltransferase [Thermoleophilaceae bacterium]
MLADVVNFLRCPHCDGDLRLADGALRCEAGHTFDLARQGYAYLLPGGVRPGGDSAAMIESREAFLGAGHFGPISEALVEAAGPTAGCVADLGAGTGHHLARLLDRNSEASGLALELSKHALRRAARAHARIGAVGCDVWRALPVRSESISVAVSVFAPRNGEEIARVLRPGGALVVVAPTRRHLTELITPLGMLSVDERKRERLGEQLSPHLRPESETAREWSMWLTHEELGWLAGMGPSAFHTDPEELAERIARLPEPMAVTASVTVSVHPR